MTVAAALAATGCGGARLVSGSGGSPATGGVSGLGGDPGAGGIPGSGGAAGSNAALCQQLGTDYAAVVSAAKGCQVGAADQCQTVVSLDPHNCTDTVCAAQTYVNDGTIVEAARQRWLAACDTPNDVACNHTTCPGPSMPPSTCVPTAPGSLHGSCMPSVPDAGFADPADPAAGESCDQLSEIYAAVVSAALACTPGAPDQCQGSAFQNTSTNFCCPNLQVAVNDVEAVQIAVRWYGSCIAPCAGGICAGTQPAECVSVPGSPGGVCVSVPTGLLDGGSPKPLPPRCPGGNCDAGTSLPLPPHCRGCDGGVPPDAGARRPLPEG